MDQILVDVDILRSLQRRAAAMTHGDLSTLGQPISDIPAIEDLRRAIDVLGTHRFCSPACRDLFLAQPT